MDLTNTLMYAAGKRGLDNIKTVGSYVGRNAEQFLSDMPIAKAIGGVIKNPTPQEVGAQISNLGGAVSDSLGEATKDPMSAVLNFTPMGMATIENDLFKILKSKFPLMKETDIIKKVNAFKNPNMIEPSHVDYWDKIGANDQILKDMLDIKKTKLKTRTESAQKEASQYLDQEQSILNRRKENYDLLSKNMGETPIPNPGQMDMDILESKYIEKGKIEASKLVEQSGGKLEYESKYGSKYYRLPDNSIVRISDHEVPLTGERQAKSDMGMGIEKYVTHNIVIDNNPLQRPSRINKWKDELMEILNPMGVGTIVGKGVKRLQVLHTNIPEDLMPVIERKKGKIIENPNKGWMKESHIEVDENGKEILPINNKKDIGFVGRFYRSGSIPDSGKSINYQNGNILDGVSVYPLPEPESFAGLQGRDWYTGKGKVVGYGPDGEPLIRPIGEWEKFSKSKSSDRYRDLNIFLDKKRIEYMSKNKISAEDFLDK